MGLDVVQPEESSYCDECPLKDRPYVAGYGYVWAPFFVVGSAPGEYESMSGVAFTGDQGLFVRDLLEDLGLNMDDVYFTNVVKRRPTDGDQNRKPTDKECWKCGSHLVRELIRSQPRVVLALGSTPFRFLSSTHHPISTVRGLTIPVRRSGVTFRLVTSYDPSYVARKGGLLSAEGNEWIEDLQEFARLVRLGKYDD